MIYVLLAIALLPALYWAGMWLLVGVVWLIQWVWQRWGTK